MIRVVLADDHPVYLDGLAGLLATVDGLEVVGTATDGAAAVETVASLRPDVVVMDVRMPVLDGIAATRRIVDADPAVGIVVLTMSEEDETLFAALRAGARGYLLKGATKAEIVRAVTAVAEGDAIFGPALARRVGEFLAAACRHGRRLPRAHRPRARGARPHRRRPRQPADRLGALPVPQDRPQRGLGDLHEAPRRRPRGGDRPAPARRGWDAAGSEASPAVRPPSGAPSRGRAPARCPGR